MVTVQAHITGFAGCYSTSTTAMHIIPSLAAIKNGCVRYSQSALQYCLACAGDIAPSTPLNSESCIFTYAANEKVSELLGDYLSQTAEANIIAHELVGASHVLRLHCAQLA